MSPRERTRTPPQSVVLSVPAVTSPVSPRERTRTPSSERGALGARSDASVDSAGAAGGFERQQRIWYDELKLRGARIVQVTYPRTANNDKELTLTRGEYLEVGVDGKRRAGCFV